MVWESHETWLNFGAAVQLVGRHRCVEIQPLWYKNLGANPLLSN